MEANPRDRWRRKRFKENLHRLLTERGLTRKAAAEAAEVDYDWLRRAVSRGIAWPDKRSMKWLRPLAKELGLDDVERLWSSTFTPTPGPYSLKDEAARLGELLRNYVVRVGPRDATVQKIVGQIMLADREHRAGLARQAQLPAGPPPVPVAEAMGPPGAVRSGPPAEVQALLEGMRSAAAQDFGKDALDRLECKVLRRLRSAGLPRMDEVAIALEEVIEYANQIRPKTPADLAIFIWENVWIFRYSQLLRKSAEETLQLIDDCLVVYQAPAVGEPSQGGLRATVAGIQPEQIPETSSEREGSPPVSLAIYSLARSVLEEFDVHFLRGYRQMGLPGVDQVAFSGDDLLAEVGQDGQRLVGDSAYYHAYRPWLAKYGAHLGITWEFADRYIQAFEFFRRRGVESHPEDGGFETLRPHALVARHRAECAKLFREHQRPAREAAGPLVARVLGSLSPEEAEHFYRGYASANVAETYLEEELVRRLGNGMVEGDVTILPEVQEEAVREVVAGIVQDFVKSKHGTDDGDTDLMADEPIAPDDKPLESRHGDLPPDEQLDHRGDPLPVGAALDSEIARIVAEDGEAARRHMDDILTPLGDLLLPGGGTYRAYLKRLGDPRSVVMLALREAKGDVGKALSWLVEKVNQAMEAEKTLDNVARRPEPSRVVGEARPRGKQAKARRMSDNVRIEDIREPVLDAHRLGMTVDEIVADLRNDEGMPESVRRAKKSVLWRKILDIIAWSEADDGMDTNEFDGQAQDDRRVWEMGYEDDLTAG